MEQNIGLEQLEYNKIKEILAGFAACEMGKERCRGLLPCESFAEAQEQMDLTRRAYDTKIKIGSNPVRPFGDVSESVERAKKGGGLSISLIMQVGNLLSVSHTAKKALSAEDIDEIIGNMAASITLNERLQRDISESFLSENEVSDSASPELKAIRRKMQKCQSKIRDKLSAMITSSAYASSLQDAIITVRDGKFVLPVKSECRGNIKGVLHDRSDSGQTVFIEPMEVVEINNELVSLSIDERTEIDRILSEFSSRIGEMANELFTNTEVLITLDVLFAKAAMAAECKATAPVLNKDGVIDLKQARHPLIDKKEVVPIDVKIEKDIDCLLITGPN
ncbi:MAG: endonuclease MutS2, partial [Clostridia bacterium]|nr:endonuclease MutS2 [Clostridia bacterium]